MEALTLPANVGSWLLINEGPFLSSHGHFLCTPYLQKVSFIFVFAFFVFFPLFQVHRAGMIFGRYDHFKKKKYPGFTV